MLRMASKRQIAANRMNAKLSCGPRTNEGIAVSSTNARKHGLSKPVTEDSHGKLRTAAIFRVLQHGVGVCEKSVDLLALAKYLADMHRIRDVKAAVASLHQKEGVEISVAIQAMLKLDRYSNVAMSNFKAAMRESMTVESVEKLDRKTSGKMQSDPEHP